VTNKTKTTLSLLGALIIVMVGAILLGAIEFEIIALVAAGCAALAVAILAGRWIYRQLSNVDATQRKDFPMTSSDRQIYLLARIDRKLTAIDFIAKIWLVLFVISMVCSLLTMLFVLLGAGLVAEVTELIFEILQEMMRGIG
jgi:hypothetical protein